MPILSEFVNPQPKFQIPGENAFGRSSKIPDSTDFLTSGPTSRLWPVCGPQESLGKRDLIGAYFVAIRRSFRYSTIFLK